MKAIIIYIITGLTLSFVIMDFDGCQNPLGYDPNVQITRITQDTTKSSDTLKPTSTIVKIDSVDFDFHEIIMMGHGHDEKPLNWAARVNSLNVILDSNDTNPKISIDLELENPTPDNVYIDKDIFYRVTKFDLSFSSSFTKFAYPLDDAVKEHNWIELDIKSFQPPQMVRTYNGSQVHDASISFDLDRYKEKGYIKAFINVNFENNQMKFVGVRNFCGFIWFYLKK
jgi:hypothetical protein